MECMGCIHCIMSVWYDPAKWRVGIWWKCTCSDNSTNASYNKSVCKGLKIMGARKIQKSYIDIIKRKGVI